MSLVLRLCVALPLLGLPSCMVLPSSGPSSGAVVANAEDTSGVGARDKPFRYALVDVGKNVADNIPVTGPMSLSTTFGTGKGKPQATIIGPGDTLQVSIFESSAGGLFIPNDAGSRPGNFVQLPAASVDYSGKIYVPYAGQITATGRTVQQIGLDIEERLRARAIEPKVLVSLLAQRASDMAVVGEVNAPNKISISVGGDRLLDALAKAGGIKHPGYETYVTLLRGGNKASVFFDDVVANDAENIYLKPKDLLYVYRQPRSFIVMGATGESGRFNFESSRLYLAEAVARGGGLDDGLADPRSVFLYRLESRKFLLSLGMDLSAFPAYLDGIPTVYRADFSNPASLFAAQKLSMRDKDIIYVSTASAVSVVKFLSLVTAGSQTVTSVGSSLDVLQGK